MPSGLDAIDDIPGARLEGEGEARKIELWAGLAPDAIERLLRILKQNGQAFSVYDAKYPSPSDPGAHFAYSPIGTSPDAWRTTLGNHGWSGGIYEIDDRVVCRQLADLSLGGHLAELKVGRVAFFGHYPVETADASRAMNDKLLAIHTPGRAART